MLAGPEFKPWSLSASDVLEDVGSSPTGLSTDQVETLEKKYGRNELPPVHRDPLWKRIARQFDNILIYILLVSGLLKAILGDWIDVAVILAVTVINAAIGFIQEGKAEGALESIRTMLALNSSVFRNGQWATVEAASLMPGDIVRVHSGDRVPADLRLLDVANLQVDESALTGESVAASKQDLPVGSNAGLGDRSNMVFSGTIVVNGQATGVVTNTGVGTEIGRIQKIASEVVQLQTPLTKQLTQLGKVLAVMILVMALIMVAVAGIFHDFEPAELLSASIGFAVAAVPEGLAALVTVTLALGVQEMAKQRAISRKLPAVETLGSVTTICSDKTGTLTKNEMTARTVRTAYHCLEVTGVGYEPTGEFINALGAASAPREALTPTDLFGYADFTALITVMTLCNDARISQTEPGEQNDSIGPVWNLVGEPTEGALRSLGMKAGLDPAGWERLGLIPFESVNKYMVTHDQSPTGEVVFHVKGEPDRILDHCANQINSRGDLEPLDREFWEQQIEELSGSGLRVLAAARQPAPAGVTELVAQNITNLEMCGLVGIVDPPRPEAIAAIEKCQMAGIRVKMITGDHAGTALAISREMGVVSKSGPVQVLTGPELEAMTTEQLRAVAQDIDVYARTSPEHKIRIVRALQSRGEVVAMTGDGVNDAPALTQADVGVAMGIKGTDATKSAADVVLADDNFATIERAVEEGRRTYDNIRKSVLFLLPTNGAQSIVILVAVLFGLTLPLQPVQILWINMISAVTLSLALAYERAEPDVMHRAPRAANAKLVDGPAIWRILFISALIGGATLVVFMMERDAGASLPQAQTTAVLMLALAQLAYLLNCRFLTRSSLTLKVLAGNRIIWVAAASLLGLQLIFTYLPFMHTWFGSAPIGARQWGITAALAVAVFLIAEAQKWVDRKLFVAPHASPEHALP